MMAELPDASLAAYDLAPPVSLFRLPILGSYNTVVGVRTGAGEFIWKTYQNHHSVATILYEHHLLTWLTDAKLSFKVPTPILTHTGSTMCHTSAGWKALAVRLPGVSLDPGHYDQVLSMGAALGELHVALTQYPTDSRPNVPAFGDLSHLQPCVPDPFGLRPDHLGLPNVPPYDCLLAWWREELSTVRSFVNGIYRTLPSQVVHRDVDPSNTLVDSGQVTAMLDFEFAGRDARALDVAASLKSIMQGWDNLAPLEGAQLFCRGYRRWNVLAPVEVESLPWLIRLRDVASVVLRIGRALQGGNVVRTMGRLEAMQASVRWIQEHGDRLIDVVGQELT